MKGDGAREQQRLNADPRQAALSVEQRRQPHGDHDQQCAFEAVAEKQHHHHDAQRFHRQQREARAIQISDEERAE